MTKDTPKLNEPKINTIEGVIIVGTGGETTSKSTSFRELWEEAQDKTFRCGMIFIDHSDFEEQKLDNLDTPYGC